MVSLVIELFVYTFCFLVGWCSKSLLGNQSLGLTEDQRKFIEYGEKLAEQRGEQRAMRKMRNVVAEVKDRRLREILENSLNETQEGIKPQMH